MKKVILAICFIFICSVVTFAQGQDLLIDDFEGSITSGPEGTVDCGAGGGSSVMVSASTEVKNSGVQSLKVEYDAVTDGYMWVARGFGLDSRNAGWLLKPESIEWPKYRAISFYVYGSDSKATIAIDIKDNGSEMWRYLFEDNFKGWKQITCPLDEFFPRGDWQPDAADKNANLDFPVRSYQFEPRPEAKGTLYFDSVTLTAK